MATPAQLYAGAAATASTTLFTASGNGAVVTSIVAANTTGAAVAVTVAADGVVIVPAVSVPANTTAVIDLKFVLADGQTLTGFAAAAGVNLAIAGVTL